MEKYPEYKIAREKVNDQTKKWIEEHPKNSAKTIITIPVVVHVVYSFPVGNISDSQIQSQIDVLNETRTKITTDS